MKSNVVTIEENFTGIELAIRRAGGQTELAQALGVTPQSISLWFKQGFVPKERAVQIEKLYDIKKRNLVNPEWLAFLEA